MHTICETGKQFLDDCDEILRKNILQTSFFVIDAKLMECCVGKDFIVNVARDDQILLMLHYANYPRAFW